MSVSTAEKNKRRLVLLHNGWVAYMSTFEESKFFHLFNEPTYDGYFKYNKTAKHLYDQLPEELQDQLGFTTAKSIVDAMSQEVLVKTKPISAVRVWSGKDDDAVIFFQRSSFIDGMRATGGNSWKHVGQLSLVRLAKVLNASSPTRVIVTLSQKGNGTHFFYERET